MKPNNLLYIALGLFVLAGCESDDTTEDSVLDNVAGVCVHSYEDEILHIDSASGVQTGAVIGELDLSSFAIDGVARTVEELVQSRSSNVTVVGDTLHCILPCSFGTQAGAWEFSAQAAGYDLTVQSVEADYAVYEGGCPSYNDTGTHISITLNEALIGVSN